LREVLSAALGERGTVRKERALYLLGQTRVHLDEVQGLGPYVELEVVLEPGQSPEDGTRVARRLMKDLGISEDRLVRTAYIDLLEQHA
jgi:predicted adenylyl cyclase CyaB